MKKIIDKISEALQDIDNNNYGMARDKLLIIIKKYVESEEIEYLSI